MTRISGLLSREHKERSIVGFPQSLKRVEAAVAAAEWFAKYL
jgi:hypothetical protein